jgi:hypothetical protein
MEMIRGKYFQNKGEKIPSMLLNRHFLKEYRFYSSAGWEHFLAQTFSQTAFRTVEEKGLTPAIDLKKSIN